MVFKNGIRENINEKVLLFGKSLSMNHENCFCAMKSLQEFFAQNFPLTRTLIFWVGGAQRNKTKPKNSSSISSRTRLCNECETGERLKASGNHAMVLGNSTDHRLAHHDSDWIDVTIWNSHHSPWTLAFATLCGEGPCAMGIEGTW